MSQVLIFAINGDKRIIVAFHHDNIRLIAVLGIPERIEYLSHKFKIVPFPMNHFVRNTPTPYNVFVQKWLYGTHI